MSHFVAFMSILVAMGSASLTAGSDPYRDYLQSIVGFEHWTRIGSYEVRDGEKPRKFDLFYHDSDLRSDGKDVGWWIYPNSFGLYCVWKNEDGQWTHKEIGGRSRVGFCRMASVEKDRIIVELHGKYHRVIRAGETPGEAELKDDLHEKANQPFQLEVVFVNGVPATKPLAEQDGKE